MGTVSVKQIFITPLKRIQVSGGDVLHGMKCSDPGYIDFGEAYFSIVESGAIKAEKASADDAQLCCSNGYGFICIHEEGAIREEIIDKSLCSADCPAGYLVWV